VILNGSPTEVVPLFAFVQACENREDAEEKNRTQVKVKLSLRIFRDILNMFISSIALKIYKKRVESIIKAGKLSVIALDYSCYYKYMSLFFIYKPQ
jgi:hypothetical protein